MSALYEHQTAGAADLRRFARRYLGDTPGLGKTRTLLATLNPGERALVVCPAIVRTHWQHEADIMGADIIVKSYDEIVRGGVPLMREIVPVVDTLILDEAHYLKNPSAKRTKLLLGRNGYVSKIANVYLASGTPLPRNPAEIWPVLASVFPEVARKYGLKSQHDFIKRYCRVRGLYVRGVWREKVVGVNPEHLDELRELLGEFMLRRTLDDVGLDVPRIDWQVLRLDGDTLVMPDVAAAAAVRQAQKESTLEEIANDPQVARMRRRLGELKAPLVVKMVQDVLDSDPSARIAVFAYHRSVLATLYDGLREYGASYIDGDTSPHARVDVLARFQLGSNRVFIGQNVACSTGMDGLQHATNRAILVEPEWLPDVNVQLGHRVARIGAKYEGRAIVQMVALAGTLDEAIVGQNARETRMVEAALAAKEAA